MTNIATAIVSEYAVAALNEKVEKLNARALRHGMSPLQVNAVEVEPKEAESGDLIPQFEVTIVGQAPRLEGWVIAAKVERDEIAKAGRTNRRLAGYAASIIRAYQKAMEWELERKTAKTKVFAGEPGKTRDLGVATVKRVRYIEGYYGTKTIVALDLPMGENEVAPLVWFASGSQEFEEGAQYHVRAGIKDCTDDERFGKQTVLTRAKLTEVEA